MSGRTTRGWIGLLLVCVVAPAGLAGQESAYDRIWSLAELYRNDENPVVQSMVLSGRFQYEYARVDDAGVTYDEWNVRRFRFGAVWGLFQSLTLHAEAEFNPQERDPFYMRLTDFNLEWSGASGVAVTVGKQGVPFTVDGSTSSKELLTIDRSNLANNMWFPQEYMPGLSVSGGSGGWMYHVGGYSAGEANREFGDLSASAFGLLSVGYDLGPALGVGEAVVRADYVYQDPNPGNTFTRQLEHVGSLNLSLDAGRWGVRADVATGAGYLGQSDLWGTMILPYVSVVGGLQLVVRHTYLDSSDPNGVRLARYENRHTEGRGDRYQELYLGANYFFYGHKLKLQSGLQFADMDDVADDGGSYSGTAWTTGFRMSW